MSLDQEQKITDPEDSAQDPEPQDAEPEMDRDDNGEVLRAIMSGDDPMIHARDKLTRHLGMTLGATMVATGIYTAYTWGSVWLWYFLILIWGLLAVHLMTFLFRRLVAGPPPPVYEISMEPGDYAAQQPPESDTEPQDETPAETEAAPEAGHTIEPPKHKITVIQPKEGDGS